ncbi:aspartate kinase [Thiospirochaeta perfilievii]|uniref:Aspartokinase n=1 Tax=Thiospirochaeta perfilievii TaxID=252967 RepID=A0A5C1Q853_9SPIO|nr:aspartate kinase [Thiospirochaeta perfilievii]QEN03220.1 aspartate kinase [Thiospirochaeta perfilievii]
MIVLKFGGTSVGSAPMIDNAIDITVDQINKSPVIVSSAMSKVTNWILEMIDYAKVSDTSRCFEIFNTLKKKHLDTCNSFLTKDNLNNAVDKLDFLFDEIDSLLNSLIMLKECSPRTKDTLLSFGERLSTTIIYYRCLERGINTELLDSRDFIKTDNNFNSAQIILEECNALIPKYILPEPNKIVISQGFISSTLDGATSTLGRGGSDYTSTIIGSALNATEVQIWTDVTGIKTSDPRIISGTKTIEHLTYTEAAELAYFGAKVVHPATIQPAVKKSIPVWVRNTNDRHSSGTKITESVFETGLKAISGKKEVTVVNITSSKMLNAYGFLRRLFSVFEKYQTPVDLISTSEVSVTITIEDKKNLDSIVDELCQLGKVKVEEDKSIICLVGQELWKDSLFISRVFSVLKDTPIRMISLGSSDTNLSFVVPGKATDSTIQLLHNEFF